jgi:hypothetical protein
MAKTTDSDQQARSKTSRRVLRNIIPLACLAWFFYIFGVPICRGMLESLYTPPALTQERVDVYRRFAAYAKAHDAIKSIYLSPYGDAGFDGHEYHLDDFVPYDSAPLKVICGQLEKVGCGLARKHGSSVLFIHEHNLLLPTPPGVLHVLDEHNPNEDADPNVAKYGPFEKVAPRWYVSMRLASPARGMKLEPIVPLPAGYIDRSLHVDGLIFDRADK